MKKLILVATLASIWSVPSFATVLCPDGSWADEQCNLCPDGSWHDECGICPNGTFGCANDAGPELCPDGTWHTSCGLCPDGNFGC